MPKFILSEKAKNDLRHLWHYTVETWSLDQAKKYYNDILDTCDAIAENRVFPGYSFEGIRPGLHGYRSHHHVIFYRILSKKKIRIVRILHDKMDYTRHFRRLISKP